MYATDNTRRFNGENFKLLRLVFCGFRTFKVEEFFFSKKMENVEKSRKFFVPKQRNQANARERDRTLSVNTAFQILRTLIPTEPKDRKLSKIETLRLATSYISHLATQLLNADLDQPCLQFLKDTSQVCTFCMALRKKKIHQNTKETSNYDQLEYYYDPGSILINGDTNQDFFQTYFF